jgi:succinyl-CoA synthetase beta subunit
MLNNLRMKMTRAMVNTPARGIKLHEYQAAQVLSQYKVAIPLGETATTAEGAHAIASKLNGCVIKSQILGGGRGMGHFKENQFQGGVHVVDTADQARDIASKMIGNHLVTKQSGADGLRVQTVYLVQKLQIEKEMYLSLTLDRAAGQPVFIYSPAGGMNIEDVAHEDPSQIYKLNINPFTGPEVEDLMKAADHLGIPGQRSQLVWLMKNMYDCFWANDCDMIEINPLVTTKQGDVLAADSKITIDTNAAYRQTALRDSEDLTQQNARENHAKQYDLNYIHIGGNIGCLVNGAGLAMSTMDIIKNYGGEPANFLDVGGSADGDQMTEAVKLLNGDDEVKAIFVNIFGGILKCDVLTQSILNAAKIVGLNKPIVLRLKGTNADIAKKMLEGKQEELGIFYEEDFDTAAQKVCSVVTGN